MPFNNLKNELSKLFSGKILIVGIGNQLRSDDGFGPALISRIQEKVKANCLDAGSSPENYIGKIVKLEPDVILFVDAVIMDEPPATIKLIKEEQIPQYGFSTHNMSPKLMIENIKSQIKVKIFMLGIQPKNLEFGEKISKELNEMLISLDSIFVEILGKDEIKK
ncbi:MAG: hydrogenase maturation peptidase HycI [Candidatus Omnitrophica bacterium]|nr:hydrogenase maturation peptidase HycI [Candidatus Omnitrophota bacterium]